MNPFDRAISKLSAFFSVQKSLKRDKEYEDISISTLESLITENLNRLAMDFAVLREKVKDGKIQHDNGGSDKEAE